MVIDVISKWNHFVLFRISRWR